MTKNILKGAFIAAAVGGFFAAGSSIARADTAADKKDGGQVACEGINSCKGTSACAGANNACKGQNGCKGHGITNTTKKDCEAKGGKVAQAKKPEEPKK